MSGSAQQALPGLEVAGEREWFVTVQGAGLKYVVMIEAMTHQEAMEIFYDEFEMYEVGVEDDDFDWDHETVFARSQEDAEKIALSRDRDYLRTYQAPCLGNDAEVVSTDRMDHVDGWRERRARREAALVNGGDE